MAKGSVITTPPPKPPVASAMPGDEIPRKWRREGIKEEERKRVEEGKDREKKGGRDLEREVGREDEEREAGSEGGRKGERW